MLIVYYNFNYIVYTISRKSMWHPLHRLGKHHIDSDCEGLSAATKLNTARLMNEDIMCTAEYNMMEEITEQMLN
jgi:hypothetical protein